MITIWHNLGLCAGVAVGNIVMYRFLWRKEWIDAIGIGVTAGVLTALLLWIVTWVQR